MDIILHISITDGWLNIIWLKKEGSSRYCWASNFQKPWIIFTINKYSKKKH